MNIFGQKSLLRICMALSLVIVGAGAANAEKIRFVLGADPQSGFYGSSTWFNKVVPTMNQTAQFVSKCTDCVKIFVIAGDLTHDDVSENASYGGLHIAAEDYGVKVFDGLGNHDSDNFADDWVSFDSEMGLYHFAKIDPDERGNNLSAEEKRAYSMTSRLVYGWSIYDHKLAFIDNGETVGGGSGNTVRQAGAPCGSFRFRDAHYCITRDAYYYTVALQSPGQLVDKPAAFLVQLHNNLYSQSAVDYLSQLRNKLRSDNQLHVPIILVSHMVGGKALNEFKTITADLNVAIHIHGHVGCVDRRGPTEPKKEHGHCDHNNNINDLRSWLTAAKTRYGAILVENSHGVGIPSVDVNAILHDIFWVLSLDTDANTVALKRMNRGKMGNIGGYESGSLQYLMTKSYVEGPSHLGHNFPRGIQDFYVCHYDRETLAGKAYCNTEFVSLP